VADILSQDEVDLLLTAVSKGEIAGEKEGRAAGEAARLPVYDFRRPERVSKDQLKGLQSLFEAFAREMSILLPPLLRTMVRVDLSSIDQLTYDEFILSVARPTALAVVNMSPLDGKAVLEMNPALVFPMVDRLLGGKGLGLSQPRELTEIEYRIILKIILMILDSLKRSWEQLVEFKLSVLSQESDPLIVQIVAGSEMVILVGYDIHVGEATGSMNLCIPLTILNPIIDRISQQAHYVRKMPAEMVARTREQIARILNKVKVPVEAILGHTSLPLSEVGRLQVGDIIQLDSKTDEPVAVEVGTLVRFAAQAGRRKDQSAVQITALVRE
jgi:flagellar motor switch protein FliM